MILLKIVCKQYRLSKTMISVNKKVIIPVDLGWFTPNSNCFNLTSTTKVATTILKVVISHYAVKVQTF